MCWIERRKTAAKEHQCERCSRTIAIGEKYVVATHVPDGRCSLYDAEHDYDVDCGEDRFKVVKLCGDCYYGTGG